MMSLYLVLLFVEILCITLIFAALGSRTIKHWKKTREEVLFHLSIFFYAIGFFFLFFSIASYANSITENHSFSFELQLLFDVIYNLFYLEGSIFYLSIFTNSRSHFEAYTPILIGFSTIITIIAGLTKIQLYNELSIIFHFLALAITIVLILLAIKHINASKFYVHADEEMRVLNIISKILYITPVLLIIDLLSFIFFISLKSIFLISDQSLVLFTTFWLIMTIFLYYFILKISRRLERINIIELLNTIS